MTQDQTENVIYQYQRKSDFVKYEIQPGSHHIYEHEQGSLPNFDKDPLKYPPKNPQSGYMHEKVGQRKRANQIAVTPTGYQPDGIPIFSADQM